MDFMKPIQVYLDDKELERLEAWTRARGWTKSQAVRAALRLITHHTERDPLLAASGMIEGLPADGAANFDRHLHATYVAERPPTYRSGKRRGTPRVRR